MCKKKKIAPVSYMNPKQSLEEKSKCLVGIVFHRNNKSTATFLAKYKNLAYKSKPPATTVPIPVSNDTMNSSTTESVANNEPTPSTSNNMNADNITDNVEQQTDMNKKNRNLAQTIKAGDKSGEYIYEWVGLYEALSLEPKWPLIDYIRALYIYENFKGFACLDEKISIEYGYKIRDHFIIPECENLRQIVRYVETSINKKTSFEEKMRRDAEKGIKRPKRNSKRKKQQAKATTTTKQ